MVTDRKDYHYWSVSRVGYNAALSRRRSRVRVPYRPRCLKSKTEWFSFRIALLFSTVQFRSGRYNSIGRVVGLIADQLWVRIPLSAQRCS